MRGLLEAEGVAKSLRSRSKGVKIARLSTKLRDSELARKSLQKKISAGGLAPPPPSRNSGVAHLALGSRTAAFLKKGTPESENRTTGLVQ